MSSLYDEMSAKANVMNQIQSVNVSKINEAKNFISLVVLNSLPDENMKQINEISFLYLLYGKDTLNAYYSTIQNIAEQCPFSGGKAVYIARGFAEMLNDTVVFDDDICLQQGYYRLQNELTDNKALNDIDLIPNPANSYADVILNKNYEGICRVKITDVYSKIVFEQSFDCNKKQFRINTTSFLNGMYNVQISVNDNAHIVSKLIIVK